MRTNVRTKAQRQDAITYPIRIEIDYCKIIWPCTTYSQAMDFLLGSSKTPDVEGLLLQVKSNVNAKVYEFDGSRFKLTRTMQGLAR